MTSTTTSSTNNGSQERSLEVVEGSGRRGVGSPGLHHVTAISGSPQATLDFHRQVLGLRLVKLTVNYDDPSTYHFYFGDRTGKPGSILTYFPWEGVGRGTPGGGEARSATYSVGAGSLGFWERRLGATGVGFTRSKKFGSDVLSVTPANGAALELTEEGGSTFDPLGTREISVERAVRGFHSVTLRSRNAVATAEVLEKLLGYRFVARDGAVSRWGSDGPGFIDVEEAGVGEGRSRLGAGSIHHIAFRCSAAGQLRFREVLVGGGMQVTTPQERKYFRSLYFREPGGVLFEIATDEPGFTVDEEPADLGRGLQLPEWLEPQREVISAGLPRLRLS